MVSFSRGWPLRSSRSHRKPSPEKLGKVRQGAPGSGGFATRTMLLATLGLVVVGITGGSLSLLRARLHQQVERDLTSDLRRSIQTFASLRLQRRLTLQRENALLADLPSLKALMTTRDKRTIVDGGEEFWKVSGNDLFALATPEGEVVAAYTNDSSADTRLANDLSRVLGRDNGQYLLSSGRFFTYAVQPLRFGDEATGTLLGYVVSGQEINREFLREVSRPAAAEALFVSGARVLVSTLPGSMMEQERALQGETLHGGTQLLVLDRTRYLATSIDPFGGDGVPVRLVLLKSLTESDRDLRDINRRVTAIGLLAFLVGSTAMLALAKGVTEPLEELTRSVRAFGRGDASVALPSAGTREVRLLSADFAAMRERITQTGRALLEAERLATIGRMASSVSHDLRHYLAAVYANAEFLAREDLTAADREELLSDISIAVHGTTELIDSLLIFSRTGYGVQRTPQRLSDLAERAIALVRAHPDAEGVTIRTELSEAGVAMALVDAKQIERALFNLLLNACQAARSSQTAPSVLMQAKVAADSLSVAVIDNGPGVPETIRQSLFEPFVSEGKQKGTGLGLTLSQSIAKEHGGSVRLMESAPGKTFFLISFLRAVP